MILIRLHELRASSFSIKLSKPNDKKHQLKIKAPILQLIKSTQTLIPVATSSTFEVNKKGRPLLTMIRRTTLALIKLYFSVFQVKQCYVHATEKCEGTDIRMITRY